MKNTNLKCNENHKFKRLGKNDEILFAFLLFLLFSIPVLFTICVSDIERQQNILYMKHIEDTLTRK